MGEEKVVVGKYLPRSEEKRKVLRGGVKSKGKCPESFQRGEKSTAKVL